MLNDEFYIEYGDEEHSIEIEEEEVDEGELADELDVDEEWGDFDHNW